MRSNTEGHEHLESDLGTAAFLVVRGFRLVGLTPHGGARYAFRFADPDSKAAGAAMDYLGGDTASAKAIIDAEKTLKTLLYTRKNGEGYGNQSNRPRKFR